MDLVEATVFSDSSLNALICFVALQQDTLVRVTHPSHYAKIETITRHESRQRQSTRICADRQSAYTTVFYFFFVRLILFFIEPKGHVRTDGSGQFGPIKHVPSVRHPALARGFRCVCFSAELPSRRGSYSPEHVFRAKRQARDDPLPR